MFFVGAKTMFEIPVTWYTYSQPIDGVSFSLFTLNSAWLFEYNFELN